MPDGIHFHMTDTPAQHETSFLASGSTHSSGTYSKTILGHSWVSRYRSGLRGQLPSSAVRVAARLWKPSSSFDGDDTSMLWFQGPQSPFQFFSFLFFSFFWILLDLQSDWKQHSENPAFYRFILQEIIFVFLLQEHNRNQSKRVIDTALRINHIFKIIKKIYTLPYILLVFSYGHDWKKKKTKSKHLQFFLIKFFFFSLMPGMDKLSTKFYSN